MGDRHDRPAQGSVFLDSDGSLNTRIVVMLGLAIAVVLGFMLAGARESSECTRTSQSMYRCGD